MCIEARDLGMPADFVIQRLKADFGPVTDGTSRTFTHRRTEVRAAPSLADGLPPEFHHAENSTVEADWIATRIESIPGTNPLGRIGILTRTHKRSEAVSRALTQQGIAHLTVHCRLFGSDREASPATGSWDFGW